VAESEWGLFFVERLELSSREYLSLWGGEQHVILRLVPNEVRELDEESIAP
jgi:hypothetical protein